MLISKKVLNVRSTIFYIKFVSGANTVRNNKTLFFGSDFFYADVKLSETQSGQTGKF